MTYITSLERRAIKRGLEQGIEQGSRQELYAGIELGLELKFGVEGLELMPEIREITDINILKSIRSGIKLAKSLDEMRQIYSTIDQ